MLAPARKSRPRQRALYQYRNERLRAARDVERGFAALYLHDVGSDHERFVDVFGREVLPVLR